MSDIFFENRLDSSDFFLHTGRMADEEDWERLGDYIVARRIALGMRDRRSLAAATGVTERTLGKVETGKRVSAGTLAALENQFSWAPGPCRHILAGGEPVTQGPAEVIPQYD